MFAAIFDSLIFATIFDSLIFAALFKLFAILIGGHLGSWASPSQMALGQGAEVWWMDMHSVFDYNFKYHMGPEYGLIQISRQ